MKLEALDHPKTLDLAALLEAELPTVIGHLELLWAFVAKKTPQGNIGKWSDGVIAGAAMWRGKPSKFVEAMVQAGFLDEDPEHRLLVHDWPEHCPNWIRSKLKREGLNFAVKSTVNPSDAQSYVGSYDASEEATAVATSRADLNQAKPSQGKPSQALSAHASELPRGGGETGADDPRGTDTLRVRGDGMAEWESHRQWALDAIMPIWPTNLVPETDWESAVRIIAGKLTNRETTRDQLLQLTEAFAAQQIAKGNRNTQFVENPVRHFDGRGRWRGPFPLPEKPGAAGGLPRPRRRTADEIEADEVARNGGQHAGQ